MSDQSSSEPVTGLEMNPDRTLSWDWYEGVVPKNAHVDREAYLETTYSFHLFRSTHPEALQIHRGASVYLGTMFDLARQARVVIGEFSLINGARIICDEEVLIGPYCLISWNVVIMDNVRWPEDRETRRDALRRVSQAQPRLVEPNRTARPVRIGSNVWIGFDVCILPGVAIGEGSIVGARSVVDRDVPPYTVVAGNPARVIRRFPQEEPIQGTPGRHNETSKTVKSKRNT